MSEIGIIDSTGKEFKLDLWIVSINPSDYVLMYYIGLMGSLDLFFYQKEESSSHITLKKGFYKKVKLGQDLIPNVEYVEEFSHEELEEIVKLLEKSSLRKGIPEINAPVGFFIFEFQTTLLENYRKEEPRTETVVCKANSWLNSINEFKKGLKEMENLKEMRINLFRNFKIFFRGRWQIIRIKESVKENWFSLKSVLESPFYLVG